MAQNFFTREMYKKLKKMDRQQAEAFIYNIYKNAYNDGYEDAKVNLSSPLDLDKLHEKLLELKGIGKVKTLAIMEIVNRITKGEPQ